MNPSVQPPSSDLPIYWQIPVEFVEVQHECQIREIAGTEPASAILPGGQKPHESRVVHAGLQNET
jgi:hypothetical protein